MHTRLSLFRSLKAAAAQWFFTLRFNLLQKHRLNKPVHENLNGMDILVLPGVLNPKIFLTGAIFTRFLDHSQIPAESEVLDLGTGSGCCAVKAAGLGARVTAVDINPDAVRCATRNAAAHSFENRIEVIEGDLFDPVALRTFDVILFNPPFYRSDTENEQDQAWFYSSLPERFAAGLDAHLKETGFCMLLLSTRGQCGTYLETLDQAGYSCQPVLEKDMWCETVTIYRVQRSGQPA